MKSGCVFINRWVRECLLSFISLNTEECTARWGVRWGARWRARWGARWVQHCSLLGRLSHYDWTHICTWRAADIYFETLTKWKSSRNPRLQQIWSVTRSCAWTSSQFLLTFSLLCFLHASVRVCNRSTKLYVIQRKEMNNSAHAPVPTTKSSPVKVAVNVQVCVWVQVL